MTTEVRSFAKKVRTGDRTALAIVGEYIVACDSFREAAPLIGVCESTLCDWTKTIPELVVALRRRTRARRERLLERHQEIAARSQVVYERDRDELPRVAHEIGYSSLLTRHQELDQLKKKASSERRNASRIKRLLEKTGN